jgi:hypothetical protein
MTVTTSPRIAATMTRLSRLDVKSHQPHLIRYRVNYMPLCPNEQSQLVSRLEALPGVRCARISEPDDVSPFMLLWCVTYNDGFDREEVAAEVQQTLDNMFASDAH